MKVNHKRIGRIYRAHRLQIALRPKSKRKVSPRHLFIAPTRPNQLWAMDFVSDAFATSRRFRVLTIKDLFTHELICLHVDRSIPGCAVARALDRVIAERGQWPDGIICDNGTELTSKAMDMWEHRTGAKLQFIEPGKPIQNAFIESFNGKFPRECLDQHWFSDLSQARQIIEAWRIETNPMRPTKPLGQLTPSEFAKKYQDEVRARTTT